MDFPLPPCIAVELVAGEPRGLLVLAFKVAAWPCPARPPAAGAETILAEDCAEAVRCECGGRSKSVVVEE